eukprot:NODE_739_length_4684_cov_0.601091.p2 type:complete len:137 gc:universal NODE_739_length_4684_cov_0.601091:3647-3237(-)
MSCIFCKIVNKEIPCISLLETETTLAFLDVGPLSKGHALVIPKLHAEKFHDLPESSLMELLPVAKKVIKRYREMGLCDDYNILQNNGKAAHQEVAHVHFHIIPKTENQGLGISWPVTEVKKDDLNNLKLLFDKNEQ